MARTAMMFAVVALSAACGTADTAAIEGNDEAAEVAIDDIRSTPVDPADRSLAIYMQIRNDGNELDRLVEADVDGCDVTEIQETSSEDGVQLMRPVEGGIAIPPLATVVLGAGALAVKCLGMTGTPAEGDMLSVTLVFERAGAKTVTAVVTEEG